MVNLKSEKKASQIGKSFSIRGILSLKLNTSLINCITTLTPFIVDLMLVESVELLFSPKNFINSRLDSPCDPSNNKPSPIDMLKGEKITFCSKLSTAR